MFKGQTYNGSSFLEFLRTDHPQQLPNFDRSDWRGLELLKATTVLALVYEDGVLMRDSSTIVGWSCWRRTAAPTCARSPRSTIESPLAASERSTSRIFGRRGSATPTSRDTPTPGKMCPARAWPTSTRPCSAPSSPAR